MGVTRALRRSTGCAPAPARPRRTAARWPAICCRRAAAPASCCAPKTAPAAAAAQSPRRWCTASASASTGRGARSRSSSPRSRSDGHAEVPHEAPFHCTAGPRGRPGPLAGGRPGARAQAATPLADQPVFSSIAVPGNLALALSVEFPTAISVAHTDTHLRHGQDLPGLLRSGQVLPVQLQRHRKPAPLLPGRPGHQTARAPAATTASGAATS